MNPNLAYCIFVVALLLLSISDVSATKRVAIIGAGAGGSSTAYYLNEYFGNHLEISVFESSERVGGRVVSKVIGGERVEMGGSVFHKLNYLFVNLAKKFNLTDKTEDGRYGGSSRAAFYDGQDFVWEESSNIYLTLASLVRRYYLSPFVATSTAEKVVNSWLRQYEDQSSFSSMNEFLKLYGLEEVKTMTTEQYLQNTWVSQLYIDEILAAQTRVTYHQEPSTISAFGGMVSIYGTSADLHTLENSNHELFEKLIEYTGAKLFLDTSVKRVDLDIEITEEEEGETQTVESETMYKLTFESGETETFDAVVLAAPLEFADISFNFPIPTKQREYQTVHVCGVHGILRPSYWGLDSAHDIPTPILTTRGSSAPFWSFDIRRLHDNGTAVCKISNANHPISEKALDSIFVSREETYCTYFSAYPKLHPSSHLSPITLRKNFYYSSSIESVLSFMEGSLLSGRNVARLMKDLWGNKSRKMKLEL